MSSPHHHDSGEQKPQTQHPESHHHQHPVTPNHASSEHAHHQDMGADAGHHDATMHHAHAGHASSAGHDDHADHGAHAGHSVDAFRQKFWLSLILTIPVVLYSHMVQEWLNFTMPEFPGSDAIAPVLGTFIFLYGGMVFLKGGWSEIRSRQPGMMLLISLALVVAFGASLATEFGWLDLDFWWELALLVTIMLLGHWLEMRAIGQAQGALAALAELLPDEAERIAADGSTEIIPLAALAKGDLVLVRPGASVPADGVIEDGQADLDESMITGESRPVVRSIGEHVVAGTVVSGSSIRIRIDAIGEDTALAGIQRLVADAQNSRSHAQALADRFAAMLFYVALASGIVTFVVWSLLGDVNEAITRTVTVLVISCPHALGLAIPLVIAISTALAAKNGILVKDRLALERMRTIDTVLFDKTGTLTEGNHALTGIAIASSSLSESEVLGLAAAAESDSEHPLARAIVQAARDQGLSIPRADTFQAIAGRGVAAMVNGSQIAVGGPAMLREQGLAIPEALSTAGSDWAARGAATLHVVRDGEVIGAFSIEDKVRPESREAVRALQQDQVRVVMITGDAQSVAQAVADDIGLDTVLAEVLPEGKQSEVRKLQQGGASVAMVGDGVNDAPALAQADVGIAIGAGTDVAIASAGVVLASSDPRAVVAVRALSKASYRKMIQNLAWAVGYNVVAIPLAAGVLAPIGFVLSPAVGAVMMSLSTIVVAINAQLLRRVPMRTQGVAR